MTLAIVFLPGMFGSALFDGGAKLWPSNKLNDTNSQEASKFKNPSFPLEPRELIQDAEMRRVFGKSAFSGYTKTTKFFKNNGFAILKKTDGWVIPPGSPTDKLFFEYPYDWRLDLRNTADLLHTFIQNTVLPFDSNIDLYIVGHGSGGLLSRTYLKKHGAATPNIKKQIFLGTPNHGFPSAYLALRDGRGLVLGRTVEGNIFAGRNILRNLHILGSNLPGIYQLLPDKQYGKYFNDFGPLVKVVAKHENSIQGTYIAGKSTVYPSSAAKAKDLYALNNDTLVNDTLDFFENFLGQDSFLADRTYAIYSTELQGISGITYLTVSKRGRKGYFNTYLNSDGIVSERSVYDLHGLINDLKKEPVLKFTRRFSGITHTEIQWKKIVLRCVLKLVGL